MHDDTIEEVPAGDELAYQAMLYASGELDGAQETAFEQLLAEDQAAREALWQAVQNTLLLEGQAAAGPDPAYRARVRQRLRQRRRLIRSAPGGAFGHPAFWVAIGAAVAVLIMVLISHLVVVHHIDTGKAPPTSRPDPGLERNNLETRLRDLGKEMADLEIQASQLKAQKKETELAAITSKLTKARAEYQQALERYRALLEKAME